MTRNWHDPDRPTPAELAAWAEGELDAADAARVGAWLRDDPDAAPPCRLAALFREARPPEPSPDAWRDTLGRIKARARRPRWLAGLWVALACSAAAVLLAVPLSRLTHRAGPPAVALDPADDNDEPFSVASADEIDVVRVHPRDAGRILIGQWLEPFVIVSSDEVELVEAVPDDEGTTPELLRKPFPMVIARADE